MKVYVILNIIDYIDYQVEDICISAEKYKDNPNVMILEHDFSKKTLSDLVEQRLKEFKDSDKEKELLNIFKQ
jgi:hypothetical protein